MSETDNNISISIDGKPITSLINRNERVDVLKLLRVMVVKE